MLASGRWFFLTTNEAETLANAKGSYRLQVRLPVSWRHAIEAEAQRRGVSVSDFAREGMFELLPAKVKRGLDDVAMGRPLTDREQ
jgi:hypothetical protein